MAPTACLRVGREDAGSYGVLGPAPGSPQGPGPRRPLSLLLLLMVCPHFLRTRGQEAPGSANEESPRSGHARAPVPRSKPARPLTSSPPHPRFPRALCQLGRVLSTLSPHSGPEAGC